MPTPPLPAPDGWVRVSVRRTLAKGQQSTLKVRSSSEVFSCEHLSALVSTCKSLPALPTFRCGTAVFKTSTPPPLSHERPRRTRRYAKKAIGMGRETREEFVRIHTSTPQCPIRKISTPPPNTPGGLFCIQGHLQHSWKQVSLHGTLPSNPAPAGWTNSRAARAANPGRWS